MRSFGTDPPEWPKRVVRLATKEDIAAYVASSPNTPPGVAIPTAKAWVGELVYEDGTVFVLGLGGLLRLPQGRWMLFSDFKPEARPYWLHIVRVARNAMKEAEKMGLRYVYLELDPKEPGAEAFAKALGFKLDQRSLYWWRWDAPQG